MANLWLIFAPMLAICIISIVVGIVLTIKKKKELLYILIDVVLVAVVCLIMLRYIPFFQDMSENRTVEFIGEYDHYLKSNVYSFARDLYFESDGETIEVFAPSYARIVANMEKGKIYKIVYFENTKVIKEYTLIE